MLAGMALGGAVALTWGVVRAPVYQADATLMVQSTISPRADAEGLLLADIGRAPVVAALSISGERVAAVARDLGLKERPENLLRRISVRSEVAAPFFTIGVRGPDPRQAATIANRLASLAEQGDSAGGEQPSVRVSIVEPATIGPGQAFARPLRDVATGAFAGAVLASLLILRGLPRGPHAEREVKARRVLGEVVLGVAAAVLIVSAMIVSVPDSLARGLSVGAGVLAVVSPAAGLALLAVMLPLRDPTGFGPLTLDLIVIAGLAYGSLIHALIMRQRAVLSAGLLAAFAFVGLAVIGAVPALNGLTGEQVVGPLASSLQLGAGVVLVIVAAFQFSRLDARPYFVLCVAAGAFVALMAVIQFVAPNALASLPAQSLYAPVEVVNPIRPGGPFENANYFGVFIAVSLIAAIGAWSIVPVARPFIVVASLPLIVALGAIALSRGAVIAAIAGLVTYVWAVSRTGGRTALFPAAILAVMVAIVVPTLLTARSEGSLSEGRTEVVAPATTDSDQQRLNAIAAAIPMFESDPIFGIGYGQYSIQSRYFLGTTTVTAAHTQYLDSFAEQGLIGVGALVSLAGALMLRLRQGSAAYRPMGVALCATYAVAALFLEPLASLQTSGTFFILIGAAVASTSGRAIPASFHRPSLPRNRGRVLAHIPVPR